MKFDNEQDGELDINKLIEVAQNVIHDPQIGFAAGISQPVQQIVTKYGDVYDLTVDLRLHDELNFPKYKGDN
ncbi:hypothetical protein [Segetibacter koreensis]|uniref:hypothetical protein n=1 Tax=Segetibacter koreensis TaxID=398037 RepID=UPI000380F1B8|nr:hypothetical protein [Segetibacter koreensis]